MKKVMNFFGMVALLLISALVILHILSNVMENFRLVTGGTVTQGIVGDTGYCPKRGHADSMWVQFTDTHGKQQYAQVENGCGYIGIPFRHYGDHVSVVYLPDTPTLARIQSDLVVQFWVMEAPILLLLLLIAVFLLRRGLRHFSNPEYHFTWGPVSRKLQQFWNYMLDS